MVVSLFMDLDRENAPETATCWKEHISVEQTDLLVSLENCQLVVTTYFEDPDFVPWS